MGNGVSLEDPYSPSFVIAADTIPDIEERYDDFVMQGTPSQRQRFFGIGEFAHQVAARLFAGNNSRIPARNDVEL